MALYDDVFNGTKIYEMLFFNVKAVLIYPTLVLLEETNKPLFERWQYLAKVKYHVNGLENKQYLETNYQDNATYYPEFSRIVAITYATLYSENNTLKRNFRKIINEDESSVIGTFMDVLHQLSSESTQSTPSFFPTFCGYNIISYDIPLLIKRFLVNKDKMINKTLPLILKRCLSIKPWESGLIDIINVWKFNGFDNTSLMLICDFLGLKKTTNLLPLNELSKQYWENVATKPEEVLEFISLQSATQTNISIQVINELRQL